MEPALVPAIEIACKNLDSELWDPAWLPLMKNASLRARLIQVHGLDKCFDYLGAQLLEEWREYQLYEVDVTRGQPNLRRSTLLVLVMTCPSTNQKHLIAVPPSETSARRAATWINHGVDPEKFDKET